MANLQVTCLCACKVHTLAQAQLMLALPLSEPQLQALWLDGKRVPGAQVLCEEKEERSAAGKAALSLFLDALLSVTAAQRELAIQVSCQTRIWKSRTCVCKVVIKHCTALPPHIQDIFGGLMQHLVPLHACSLWQTRFWMCPPGLQRV